MVQDYSPESPWDRKEKVKSPEGIRASEKTAAGFVVAQGSNNRTGFSLY